MIKVLIVEDEKMASARLQNLLAEYDPEIKVLAHLDSVKNAVQWLMNNPSPELIFMDIQLGDGISFEIFDFIKIDCPIIFITAYNEYAIEAFQVNSVDYLLKPLNKDDLFKAMEKFKTIFGNKVEKQVQEFDLNALKEIINNYKTNYKNRFIIKNGEHLKAVPINNILYFFSREKGTFIQTDDNRRYLLDYTMDQAEKILDPTLFFRINRQYIVSFEAITDMVSYTNSRIKLILQNSTDEKDIIVSREKVSDFKKWLDR